MTQRDPSADRMPLATNADGGPGLLALLRDATRQQHAMVEKTIRLDASFTLERYIAVLQVFDRFLRRWEPAAAAVLPEDVRSWFWARSRGALATQDLARLQAGQRCDLRAGRAAVSSSAAAWGGMYVIEGSALGGQIIARTLREQFGITVDNGGAFFGARGPDTARLWREFCATMAEQVRPDAAARAEACRGAIEIFGLLGSLFSEGLAATDGDGQEANGIVNAKVLPLPGVLVALSVPPCACTMPLQM